MNKKHLVIFFVLVFFCLFISAENSELNTNQNVVSDVFLSDNIFSTLKDNGFSPSFLTNKSQSIDFPYNVLLTLEPKNECQSQLIIAVSQTEASFFLDEICSFSHNIKEKLENVRIIFFFSSLDTPSIPSDNFIPVGTNQFVSDIDKSVQTVCLILQKESTQKNQQKTDISVVPGIKEKVAPLWLIKNIFDIAESQNFSINMAGSFVTFYRLGFMQKDPVLAEYLNADIPAVILECSKANAIGILEPFIEYLSRKTNFEWDANYSFISLNNKKIFFPEKLLIYLLMCFSFFPLLYLCLFTFFHKKKRISQLRDLKKSWFLLPLMIVLTCVLLYVGQIITKIIYPVWQTEVISALFLKIAVALFFLIIITAFHRFIPFPSDFYTYSLFLTIIAYGNIFIFSFFDISLIILFCFQFAVVFLSIHIKKTFQLILVGILMLLPFTTFLTALFTTERQNIFQSFFEATLFENFLIACFVLPIEFLWIRIVVSLKIFGSKVKPRFPFLITSASILIFVFVAHMVITGFNKQLISQVRQVLQIELTTDSTLEINYSTSSFLDRMRVDVFIQDTCKPLRYKITVTSKENIAVFDANYPFESKDSNQKATFILDDYPPNPLKLEYTCEKNSISEIEIESFVKDENDNFIKRIDSIIVKP